MRLGAGVRSRLIVLLLAILTVMTVAASRPLLAGAQATRSFVWDRVDIKVALQEDSTLHVTERDRAIFPGGPFRTGSRDIPLARIEQVNNVRVASVTPTGLQPFLHIWTASFSMDVPNTFTTRTNGTMLHIEWSFPATTSQSRTFQIDYDARGALRVYPDHDPSYQQITWIGVDHALTHDAPVNTATLTFVLPRPVDPEQTHVIGPGGSAPGEYFTSGQTWTWMASNLHSGDSLEASLQFPPLVRASKPAWQDASDRAPRLTLFFLGLALIIAIGGGIAVLAAWWTRGRDPEIGPVPDILVTPPAELPPAVVGAVVDEQVDQRDIVATLVDPGQRGVLRIEPTSATGILERWRRQDDFIVTLQQGNADLSPFERALLETFFDPPFMTGSVRLLSAMRRPSRKESEKLRDILYDDLVQRGFFAARPSRTRKVWTTVGTVLLAVVYIAAQIRGGNLFDVASPAWMLIATFLALGLLVSLVARVTPRKTVAGAEAAAKWGAFKKYLEQIDQFEQLDTARDLFDCYLPYAIAFGIDKTWIETFSRFGTLRRVGTDHTAGSFPFPVGSVDSSEARR